MAGMKNYNGRFCESDYENALIAYLEELSWQYLPGSSIPRKTRREVLYLDDLEQFLRKTNPDFTPEDIRTIAERVQFAGAESEFATLHMVYNWLSGGLAYKPDGGPSRLVALIDYERPRENIFRVVNQLTVEYTDNGQKENRRPDVLLFVNGIPLCIMEFKSPSNERATIYDAWEQITSRYWRDIPHLLHYCPLACISDGVKTRLGAVRAPYEHFYAWRRVEDDDKISIWPFDETQTMVNGVFAPERFLEIFRDYIYFQDAIYDREELEIVCRYPQFFAARLLKRSIIKSIREKNGKGGTYFGATGCGKTYTMAFLARQLSMRCADVPEIGSPTIVMIVDRDDLQKQGARLFTRSEDFLNLGEVRIVPSRQELRRELGARESGGFYICTIQKFCDRREDPVGLVNKRGNIICFSDEAHRTQVVNAKKIRLRRDVDETLKEVVSKSYAKVLREAFPHATFVGFTGTPVDKTYRTFGDEIDRYTMDQSVADGITVPIKYHPRITKVLLNEEKAKEIEEYYRQCADGEVSAREIEASQRAMSSLEVILRDPDRLERLAVDIHDHYAAACEGDPDRVQKAMIVCSQRQAAFALLEKFREKYPEWFELRRTPEGVGPDDEEEQRELKEMPFLAMVASVGSNDKKEMYDYLGGVKNDQRSDDLAAAFKQEKSNLRIVIVVDMWMTGFDVPTLTYLYNDKPLQKHQLIQTISRVNRKYPGKEYGLIIDYIGIREHMRRALKLYGGEGSIASAKDDVEQAAAVFRERLEALRDLFENYDLKPFLNPDTAPAPRYELLARAAEYIFASAREWNAGSGRDGAPAYVPVKKYFLQTVREMRTAHDICLPSGVLSEKELALAQCFMAIAAFARKMSGTSDLDAGAMNRRVEKMVREALEYNHVESVLNEGEEEEILTPEYLEALSRIKMPASRLEVLVKALRRGITDYKKTNRAAAKKYQEKLEETIREYHERRKRLSEKAPGEGAEDSLEESIEAATQASLKLLKEMAADRVSFSKLGLTYEEKAFYDILAAPRELAFGELETADGVTVNEKCRALARRVKKIIDKKASIPDWLNNQNVRDRLKFDVKVCLVKNGYPPQYVPEVFREIMEQVENFNGNV